MHHIELGVTRTRRTPLTELLDVFERELTLERQRAIEHRTHVTRIQIEAVAACPFRIFWIIDQVLAEEYVDKVCASHSTTGVTRVSFLNHRGSQNTDVIGCTIHQLNVVHNII